MVTLDEARAAVAAAANACLEADFPAGAGAARQPAASCGLRVVCC
jgi:hypothetical protein